MFFGLLVAALGLMYLMGSRSSKAGHAVIENAGLNRHTWEFQIILMTSQRNSALLTLQETT